MNKINNNNKEFFESANKLVDIFNSKESIPSEEIDKKWDMLCREYTKKKNNGKKKILLYFSFAASIVILFSFLFFFQKKDNISNKNATVLNIQKNDSLSIIIKDNNQVYNIGKDSKISYNKSGNFVIENYITKKETGKFKLKSDTCSIFVPFGQIANIMLSDSSEVTLNAGSSIIFPKNFASNKREVTVNGEAYFNVRHNEEIPFFVTTKNFSVNVLGTIFNVNCNETNSQGSVVLIKGSVLVESNNSNLKLSPSEKAEIFADNIVKSNVDIDEYISWKDKVVFLDNKSIKDVLYELSHYYNINISNDKSIDNFYLSGKLELNDDYKKTLEVLSITFSIKYMNKNGNIIFTKNN
ncbi:MAG: FecR family protein [Bacteroidales bacterium]|nr:FecR family protein [Bacteroidales bacterium]